MGYNLLIGGIYWGYNPLTNLLLTSWDIQVSLKEGLFQYGIHLPTIDFQGKFVSFQGSISGYCGGVGKLPYISHISIQLLSR